MKQKRNLSGVFIFQDKKPTCIEDCELDIQKEWLDSLNEKQLKQTVLHLCNTLNEIGNELDIIRER
ncbi:MAG TPA: hypothetical protein VK982_07090 [Bacteroidales bacterium]|nr:hypothetical protein [Bacteroidales bacterium]